MAEQSALSAYEQMAPFYDDFTAHHDYRSLTVDLLDILGRWGLRGDRLLDVGCGTGNSFMEMLSGGWKVTACDISPLMLAKARAKSPASVRLEVADMRELPALGEFDLIWALDDAVNYLLSLEELVSTLTAMRANLAPAGLLLFDVNELLMYRTFFAEESTTEFDGRRVTWRGLTARDVAPGSICEAEGIAGAHVARHQQRHFPEATVLQALDRAGLQCLAVYGSHDGGLEQPLDQSAHTKAVYVARTGTGNG